jgi:uncharacterized protein YqeY
MNLEEKLMVSIKEAMKSKDKVALDALRSIKSAILLAKTEKAGATLDEKAEISLLQRLQKQRKESATIFREQGRDELANEEEAQLKVIEQFLPKPLSAEELEALIKEVIDQTGASGIADMGKVMGMANQKVAGRAGGKEVSDMVRKMLSA